MKLTKGKVNIDIDTSGLTLGELLEELETLFPTGKWADFKIKDEYLVPPVGPPPGTFGIKTRKPWSTDKKNPCEKGYRLFYDDGDSYNVSGEGLMVLPKVGDGTSGISNTDMGDYDRNSIDYNKTNFR